MMVFLMQDDQEVKRRSAWSFTLPLPTRAVNFCTSDVVFYYTCTAHGDVPQSVGSFFMNVGDS